MNAEKTIEQLINEITLSRADANKGKTQQSTIEDFKKKTFKNAISKILKKIASNSDERLFDNIHCLSLFLDAELIPEEKKAHYVNLFAEVKKENFAKNYQKGFDILKRTVYELCFDEKYQYKKAFQDYLVKLIKEIDSTQTESDIKSLLEKNKASIFTSLLSGSYITMQMQMAEEFGSGSKRYQSAFFEASKLRTAEIFKLNKVKEIFDEVIALKNDIETEKELAQEAEKGQLQSLYLKLSSIGQQLSYIIKQCESEKDSSTKLELIMNPEKVLKPVKDQFEELKNHKEAFLLLSKKTLNKVQALINLFYEGLFHKPFFLTKQQQSMFSAEKKVADFQNYVVKTAKPL